jgi:hypothetical protein
MASSTNPRQAPQPTADLAEVARARLTILDGLPGLNTEQFRDTVVSRRVYSAATAKFDCISTTVNDCELIAAALKPLDMFAPEVNTNFKNLTAADWKLSYQVENPLVWRAIFHKISISTLSMFHHISLATPLPQRNRQVVILGSQPDLGVTKGIFPDQVHSEVNDETPPSNNTSIQNSGETQSLLLSLHRSEKKSKDALEGMDLLAYAVYPPGSVSHQQKMVATEFVNGDVEIGEGLLATPLHSKDIRDTADVVLGPVFGEYLSGMLPQQALYMLLHALTIQYNGFSYHGCLRLIKNLVEGDMESPTEESVNTTLEALSLKGKGDVFFMAMLMMQTKVKLRIAALDGRVRLMAATHTNLGTKPARNKEELFCPRRLPPHSVSDHLSTWYPSFQLYWLDADWDNTAESPISPSESWTTPFKHLMTSKEMHRNLRTPASLRHLLAQAIDVADTASISLNLGGDWDKVELKTQILEGRRKALQFILTQTSHNIGADSIVKAFLKSPNTNQGQLSEEEFLNNVLAKDCWQAMAGKYQRAADLNWFCVLICDFARNGVSRDSLRSLVMSTIQSPLSMDGDLKGIREAWRPPLRFRDEVSNTLFKLMKSSQKSKHTLVLKYLLRIQVDPITFWPLPFPDIPPFHSSLHSYTKGNNISKLVCLCIDRAFNNGKLRLSTEMRNFLEKTEIDLSQLPPVLQFQSAPDRLLSIKDTLEWLGDKSQEATDFLTELNLEAEKLLDLAPRKDNRGGSRGKKTSTSTPPSTDEHSEDEDDETAPHQGGGKRSSSSNSEDEDDEPASHQGGPRRKRSSSSNSPSPDELDDQGGNSTGDPSKGHADHSSESELAEDEKEELREELIKLQRKYTNFTKEQTIKLKSEERKLLVLNEQLVKKDEEFTRFQQEAKETYADLEQKLIKQADEKSRFTQEAEKAYWTLKRKYQKLKDKVSKSTNTTPPSASSKHSTSSSKHSAASSKHSRPSSSKQHLNKENLLPLPDSASTYPNTSINQNHSSGTPNPAKRRRAQLTPQDLNI